MSSSATNPLHSHLQWLARHAGFPAHRLPDPAARLLLMAVAAAAEEESARGAAPFKVQGESAAQRSSQRAHALNRARVHFKVDNSAKV